MTICSVAWLDGHVEPECIAAAIERLYPTRISEIAASPAVADFTQIAFPDAANRQDRRMSVLARATCEPIGGTDPCTWISLGATDDGPEIIRRLAMHFGGYYAADDSFGALAQFFLSGHELMAREAEKREAAASISGARGEASGPILSPKTDPERK